MKIRKLEIDLKNVRFLCYENYRELVKKSYKYSITWIVIIFFLLFILHYNLATSNETLTAQQYTSESYELSANNIEFNFEGFAHLHMRHNTNTGQTNINLMLNLIDNSIDGVPRSEFSQNFNSTLSQKVVMNINDRVVTYDDDNFGYFDIINHVGIDQENNKADLIFPKIGVNALYTYYDNDPIRNFDIDFDINLLTNSNYSKLGTGGEMVEIGNINYSGSINLIVIGNQLTLPIILTFILFLGILYLTENIVFKIEQTRLEKEYMNSVIRYNIIFVSIFVILTSLFDGYFFSSLHVNGQIYRDHFGIWIYLGKITYYFIIPVVYETIRWYDKDSLKLTSNYILQKDKIANQDQNDEIIEKMRKNYKRKKSKYLLPTVVILGYLSGPGGINIYLVAIPYYVLIYYQTR